jgi:hypothetical protein
MALQPANLFDMGRKQINQAVGVGCAISIKRYSIPGSLRARCAGGSNGSDFDLAAADVNCEGNVVLRSICAHQG